MRIGRSEDEATVAALTTATADRAEREGEGETPVYLGWCLGSFWRFVRSRWEPQRDPWLLWPKALRFTLNKFCIGAVDPDFEVVQLQTNDFVNASMGGFRLLQRSRTLFQAMKNGIQAGLAGDVVGSHGAQVTEGYGRDSHVN